MMVFHLVFAGNETDIKTVGRAITRLKEEFAISDCLLIFDRGMVSEENIGELVAATIVGLCPTTPASPCKGLICGLKKNKVVKAMLRGLRLLNS